MKNVDDITLPFLPFILHFEHYFFALSKDLHHCGSCLWWKWRTEKIRSVSQLWAPSSYKWNRKMRIKILFWLKRMRSMKCAEEEEKHNQNHSELFTSTPTNISNFIVQKKIRCFFTLCGTRSLLGNQQFWSHILQRLNYEILYFWGSWST